MTRDQVFEFFRRLAEANPSPTTELVSGNPYQLLVAYTQTAVDPSDDCTIWYVGDYLKRNAASYSTRISGLRFPDCTPRR